VPELRFIKSEKEIHDPWGRGSKETLRVLGGKEGGYPKMIVEHKAAREKCLRVYKEGLGKGGS
jgi:deoxyribodipyrimidine photo-lyase